MLCEISPWALFSRNGFVSPFSPFRRVGMKKTERREKTTLPIVCNGLSSINVIDPNTVTVPLKASFLPHLPQHQSTFCSWTLWSECELLHNSFVNFSSHSWVRNAGWECQL